MRFNLDFLIHGLGLRLSETKMVKMPLPRYGDFWTAPDKSTFRECITPGIGHFRDDTRRCQASDVTDGEVFPHSSRVSLILWPTVGLLRLSSNAITRSESEV